MKNSNSSLRKFLLSVKFSEKEADTYLALLELGTGTVSQIARRAGINRTTGYVVLDWLVSHGLATMSGKEPKQEYMAESPDKLKTMLQKRAARFEEAIQDVDLVIPQLKSFYNVGVRPQIKFYEGKEGLIEVYEDTLTAHEPIRAYASVEDTQHTLPHYFPKYYKRRAAKKIPIRAIFPKTPEALELVRHNKEELRQTVLVSPENFSFSPEINIYDNKVMIASWKEKLGIIIESQEIADAMKKTFELAWIGARHEVNRI